MNKDTWVAMGVLIHCCGLTKNFGEQFVFSGVDVAVYEHEILGIIGVSGVGKSTLLKMLTGFLSPDKGAVYYYLNGKRHDIATLRRVPRFYSWIGFSSQDCSFYDELTIEENMELYATLHHVSHEEMGKRIAHLLSLFELEEKRHVLARHLSSGMQKKLDFACALVHQPRILFLDEPTAHLDSINRMFIWHKIQEERRRGATIVVTSHFLGEVEHICDRVFLMNGQMLRQVK